MLNKIIYIVSSFFALLSFGFVPAYAEGMVISGNGADSQNQVNVSVSSQTTVAQESQATIQNNVDNNANTGNNVASDNAGKDTSIQTGDIASTTTIANSVNTSLVEAGCCPTNGSESQVVIEGNGPGSNNTIDTTSKSTTTITVTQTAEVKNNVTTNASTGNNSANDNNGNVSIDTGNITIGEKIENSAINLAHVSAGTAGIGSDGDVRIIIKNNGAHSENSIFPQWFAEFFLIVDNNAYINNTLDTNASSGGNSADGNSGDVTITTGDIAIGVTVANDINKSIADVACCGSQPFDPGKPTPQPQPPPTPIGGSGGGGSGGSGSNSGSGGGETLAAAIGGSILPATGFNWFLATIANIFMFLFGLYLRRRSGNSPGAEICALAA